MKFNYAASREQLLSPLPVEVVESPEPLSPKNPPSHVTFCRLGRVGGPWKVSQMTELQNFLAVGEERRKVRGATFPNWNVFLEHAKLTRERRGESSFPRLLLLLLAKCRDSFLSPHLFHPLLGGTRNGSSTLKWGGFGTKTKK